MKWLRSAVPILVAGAVAFGAELNDRLGPPLDHPAIRYWTGSLADPVAVLNAKLWAGDSHLKFEGPAGYLRSVLDALNIPIESQIAVFSKTSLQAPKIRPDNPRTIFFNDSVTAAWMSGGFIELASHDSERGVIFYSLSQQPNDAPSFQRRSDCLSCHVSDASLGVPGTMIRSLFTAPDGTPKLILGGSLVDHRTPIEDRWGGFYVTGATGAVRHMGNAMVTDEDHPQNMITAATLKLTSLEGRFDTGSYLSPYSDAAALMVFDHQMHMMNLITRVGWEIRAAQHDKLTGVPALLRDAAEEFVDYLFFIDEAPLSAPMETASPFAKKFAAQGPRDTKGRSLRDLDLQHRVLRYPCSYMIYSAAFDALPVEMKDAIYQRMWQVLSGAATERKYARLSLTDRQAIVEILRDTKKDLPAYVNPAGIRP